MKRIALAGTVSALCLAGLTGCGTEKSTNLHSQDIIVRYQLTQIWSQDYSVNTSPAPNWALTVNMKSMDFDSVLDFDKVNKPVRLEAPETIVFSIGNDSAAVTLTTLDPPETDQQAFLQIFGDDKIYVAELPHSTPQEAYATFYRASGEVITTAFPIYENQVLTSPAAGSVYALGDSFTVTWNQNDQFESVRFYLVGCGEIFEYRWVYPNTGSVTLKLDEAQLPEGVDACDATLKMSSAYSFPLVPGTDFHSLSEAEVELVDALLPLRIVR
jgi:hypothetical protein